MLVGFRYQVGVGHFRKDSSFRVSERPREEPGIHPIGALFAEARDGGPPHGGRGVFGHEALASGVEVVWLDRCIDGDIDFVRGLYEP